MRPERIIQLEMDGVLKKRSKDIPRMRSLIKSAEETGQAAMKIPLEEDMATIIFVSIYEALRKLGDCKWWLRGYEPKNHEVTFELLSHEQDTAYRHVDRFRKIRHDANYRGYKVTIEQAKEIIDFWNQQGMVLLTQVKTESGEGNPEIL